MLLRQASAAAAAAAMTVQLLNYHHHSAPPQHLTTSLSSMATLSIEVDIREVFSSKSELQVPFIYIFILKKKFLTKIWSLISKKNKINMFEFR
jgi:hypothetical protein